MFAVFSFCWALSGLLDLAPFGLWRASPAHALFGISSLVVLLRPGWLPAFAAMNALRLVAFVVDSPQTANHQVLCAIAAATILASLPQAVRRAGGWRSLDGEGWRALFAPALRLQLVLLYGFAVLHKLNHDYLDPRVSCALDTLSDVLPGLVWHRLAAFAALQPVLIYGSLATELLIPVLLLGRRTRRVGIVVGLLFHTVLGIRFFAFSTGLLALYSLFVPAAALDQALAARQRRRGGPLAWLYAGSTVRVASLVLVAGFTAAASAVRRPGAGALAEWGFPLLAGLWTGSVLVAVGSLLWPRGRSAWREPLAGGVWGPAWLLVFAALVVANGMSPYLGLRTVPTFSMFSNLRTEGGITNHLFMPATALRVAAYQEDLITMLEAEDEELRRFSRRPRRAFYDLKLRVQKMAAEGKTGIRLAYRRAGRVERRSRAEEDPELMAPISWWERKWLRFRPVPVSRQRKCAW